MRSALGTDSAHSRIFESVFINDIKMLKSMKDLWKTRKEPILLNHKNLESLVKQLKPLDQSSIEFDQTVWDIAQNYKVFQTSLDEISKDLIKQRKRDPNLWFTFDKDDERFLNFVTATSNLRAHIFGIELKSRFAVKEIAGNIIPAIATTNAIVAGMIVMLAFKILMGQINECNYTFVAYGGDRTHLLMNEGLSKPNPQCVVCSNSYFMAKLNLDQTLETLVTAIQSDLHLKGEITIQNGEQYYFANN
jgi:ubiquitin-like 1-activating enzyme E1 B